MGVRKGGERGSAANRRMGIPPENTARAGQFGREGSFERGEDESAVAGFSETRQVCCKTMKYGNILKYFFTITT